MSSSVPPVISVVVPCYNVASQVSPLLDCLSKQEFDLPWEIVFVDNRSTDDTVAVIENYDGELPFNRVVAAPDIAGAGYARNVGVMRCNAAYVAFCDADDEIPHDWVYKMYAAVTEFGFVGCLIEETEFTANKFSGLMTDHVGEFYDIGFLPYWGAGAMGIRKDIFLEVGGFDKDLRICEDMDLCYRVQLSGYPLHADTTNKIFYRARESNWALMKQRFIWGRYEKAMARRYKDFGHSQELIPGGALKAFLKSSIILLLRCYDPEKRLRYGKFMCKALASLLPAIEAAKLPVIIEESQLDSTVVAQLSEPELTTVDMSA